MRTMQRTVCRGAAAACALLLPWIASAQTDARGGAGAAQPKVEVRRGGAAANLLGMGAKEGAKDDGKDKPRETVITANKIDFDNKEQVILFDENVLVDDAQFTMRSDRLIVFLKGTDDVSQIMAIGNVKITNEDRYATCDKAVYTKEGSQIVMTANKGAQVRLETKGEKAGTVTGAGVVMWLDDERVQVLAEAVVHPDAGDAPPQARVVIPTLGAFKDAQGKKKPEKDAEKEKE